MNIEERFLPDYITARATLRGNEYAWPIGDIPAVIEAAKAANLINIGGQLQFRIPEGGTCECYWVEVDTYKEVSTDLPWAERVRDTAAAALSQFKSLCNQYNFIAEGRSAFGARLNDFESQGGEISEALCLVWYVESQKEAVTRQG